MLSKKKVIYSYITLTVVMIGSFIGFVLLALSKNLLENYSGLPLACFCLFFLSLFWIIIKAMRDMEMERSFCSNCGVEGTKISSFYREISRSNGVLGNLHQTHIEEEATITYQCNACCTVWKKIKHFTNIYDNYYT